MFNKSITLLIRNLKGKKFSPLKTMAAIATACKGTGVFILAGTLIYTLILPICASADLSCRLLTIAIGATGFAVFAGVYTIALSAAGHSLETTDVHYQISPLSRAARMLFSGLTAGLVAFGLSQLTLQPALMDPNHLYLTTAFFLTIGMVLALSPKGEFFQPVLSIELMAGQGQRLSALKKKSNQQDATKRDVERKILSERFRASMPAVSFKKTDPVDIQNILKKVSEMAGQSLDSGTPVSGMELYGQLNSSNPGLNL